MAGRVLGKLVGITPAAWVAGVSGWPPGRRGPAGPSWPARPPWPGSASSCPCSQPNLAFPDGRFQGKVKLGLLLASVLAGAAGALVLFLPGLFLAGRDRARGG